jgi:hypothetical protein
LPICGAAKSRKIAPTFWKSSEIVVLLSVEKVDFYRW